MAGPGSWPSHIRGPIGTSNTAGSGNTAAHLLPDRGTAASVGSHNPEPAAHQQERPSLACLILLPILLLGIAGLSAVPLAGARTGWGYFYKEGMNSVYLRDLTLSNWTHYIHIGYNEQSNAIREYAWAHKWDIKPYGLTQRYAKLWDNSKYGDATQLVGGYTAGYLVLSCVTAVAYLGLWLRCVMHLRSGRRGDPEAPAGGTTLLSGGTTCESGGTPSNKCLIRPLGAYLWPVALVHTVLLATLVIAFFLLMDATTAYQTLHLAPGQACHVAPDWAWWSAMSAVFAWLTVTLIASAEAIHQGRKETAPDVSLRSPQSSAPLPQRPPRALPYRTTPQSSA